MSIPSEFYRPRAVFLLAILVSGSAAAEEPLAPKYGPRAVRLFESREFVRTSAARDYWALSPYYVSQPDHRACSAACAAMAVNALRAEQKLGADDELATPASVVAAVPAELWRTNLAPEGEGVTLDEFAVILERLLPHFGIAQARVETHRFAGADRLARLRRLLAENERSSGDVVIVNFLQSAATGDPEGAVGHLAPIGAYDAAARRVLLFDPDRRWYEPYWISDETLLQAMAAADPVSSRSRGLVRIVRERSR